MENKITKEISIVETNGPGGSESSVPHAGEQSSKKDAAAMCGALPVLWMMIAFFHDPGQIDESLRVQLSGLFHKIL